MSGNVRIEITATPKTAADMLEAIEDIVTNNPDSGIQFVNVVKTQPTPATPPTTQGQSTK
jgi:hypothetical protein